MAKPTPEGVPVAMTSPGSSVSPADKFETMKRDAENHLRNARPLALLAVDVHRQFQRARIADFLAIDDPGTQWQRRIQRLALEPLVVTLLQVPRSHVVGDGVTEDVIHGFGRSAEAM